jgi:hypothetical protein
MKIKSMPRSCSRQAQQHAAKENGALILATSRTHAREIATDLKRQGHVATVCGSYVFTDATFRTAARASKVKK